MSTWVQIHFRYAHLNSSSSFVHAEQKPFLEDQESVRVLFAQIKSFLAKDLSQLLESSQRAENLSQYLKEGAILVQKIPYYEYRFQSDLERIELQMATCEELLERANLLFSESLEHDNESTFTTALERAQEARTCLGKQYVLKRATQTLLDKLQSAQTTLTPQLHYLQMNQELIIKHYDILKPSLLSELYRLSLQVGPKS